MLSELIPIPKTKAGQYYKEKRIAILRERLTSYGSQALVKFLSKTYPCYIIVYWDTEAESFIITDCNQNMTFANRLWEEIV